MLLGSMAFHLPSLIRLSRTSPSALKLMLAVYLLLQLGGCGTSEAPAAAAAQMPPVPVKTSLPLQKNVVEWDEYTGHIEATETVEIRARVSGYLDKVNFKDGDKVRKGDLLFIIDPRPYRAELERAEAELERTRARLELARNDLRRAEHLRRSKALSEEEYDARSKGVRESAGAVRSAEAAVRTARLNLGFTEIRAPIDGRIGRELITVGNLVNSDQTLLTTIVSVDPVYVYIDADERAVLKYRRLAAKGHGIGAHGTQLPAELALLDETGFPHRGYIDYVEPRMDAATGTLRVRGLFPNPNELLSPGFFARLRIHGNAPHPSLLIPDRAIGTDQGQKFVWIAREDGSIEYRRIVAGTQFGQLRAVAEGLKPDDQIVVEGIQKLRPGAKVKAERIVVSDAD
jgi:multidrug efflux system membrane fusion protein